MLFRSDRKSTRLNSSHTIISYAVFCLKKKKNKNRLTSCTQRLFTTTPPQRQPALLSALARVPCRARPRGELGSKSFALFFFLKIRAPPEFHPLPHPPPFRI